MSVVQVQQIRVQSVRRQLSSHSCSPLSMDTVVACPLCAITDAGWWSMSLLAQFIDGYGRPCDHAVTLCVATVEVPQIQFIAGVSGHYSCNRDGYSAFSSGGYGGDEGFFGF